MEADLGFIRGQLWAVIGLLLAILVGNVLCNLRHRPQKNGQSSPLDFRDLYQLDKLDELIAASRDQLRTHPNSTDALYYGGLALLAQRRYPEAHEYFERLATLDPSMRVSLQAYLTETAGEPSS